MKFQTCKIALNLCKRTADIQNHKKTLGTSPGRCDFVLRYGVVVADPQAAARARVVSYNFVEQVTQRWPSYQHQ